MSVLQLEVSLVMRLIVILAAKIVAMMAMPAGMVVLVSRKSKDFLWGGRALEWKTHLVKWMVVCSNKSKGGLGVRCLYTLNKALLCKWS